MSEASHPIVSRPLQARFLTIPQAPLCYWLREQFFELLAGRTLGDVADVCQGLATADDGRFVRFVWEVQPEEWTQPVRGRRWVPFEKGGGYGKWFGHHFWVVDWGHDGARIKATPGPRVQNEQHYFKEGWTYSQVARGSLGFRALPLDGMMSSKSSGIFPRDARVGLGAVLSCRASGFIARAIAARLDIRESYVARVPLPDPIPDPLAASESTCIALKRYLVAFDPTERSFVGTPASGLSLVDARRRFAEESEAVAAVLHTIEGRSEREVFKAYGVDGDDLQAVLDETGTPAGWFPLIAGYDAIPELPQGLSVPAEVLEPLVREERQVLSPEALNALKRRLRAFYEAGPGGRVDEEEEDTFSGEDGGDGENEVVLSGARIPIPAETFLEELAQRLDVHPISIYWLLRELRHQEGAVSKPELVRFVEDYLCVLVLRLLGHRWPREVEAKASPPAWADPDGVIPLFEGTSEPTLLARVRARIAADFGAEHAGAVERECEDIVGRPLSAWLGSEFFKCHMSQFRKRPIALQIVSASGDDGKPRGRGMSRNTPAFSCLVYYHRLDEDLLPKLRTQYVGPLRTSFQTELGSLDKIKERSADQDTRRLELEERVEELKALDARLERVIVEGFATPALDKIAAKEPIDKWTSRDGQAPAPATQDAFLAQERRYNPDLNDGVRVNIAPIQRAGLLATSVLAPKDVEKAIADRAEWRADERRWCRECKLPRPGWWPSGEQGLPYANDTPLLSATRSDTT
ncbi:MAG: hypothetical protein HYX75_02120 [Acidobacteria bacterium]|nr:hypothetical protein [Acidobacteriota bacterium]